MANISHLPRTPASVPTPDTGYITIFTDSTDLTPKYINSNREVFDYLGPRGFSGTVEVGSVTTVASNIPADVTNVGTANDAILDFIIPRGKSITNIARTSGTGAENTTDTYTITYDDADTDTFTVYNGSDGRSITNISRTSGTGAPGTTDTYTITYSKAPLSTTFTVYNGANGMGTGTAVVPQPVGNTGTAGTAGGEYANPDHVHAHGNQTNAAHHAVATTGANGFMSSTDKSKLDTVQSGAEVNQNAFSVVTGNSGTATAEAKTDTIAITGTNGISTSATDAPDGLVISPTFAGTILGIAANSDAGNSNDFARGNHVHAHGNLLGGGLHALATASLAGFQAAADKARQDNNAKFEVNVLDFGADPTGATSSRTAFINAIAALPASGGVIHVPSGVYDLGGTAFVLNKAHVTIRGASRYNTVLLTTSLTEDILQVTEFYCNVEELTFRGPFSGTVEFPTKTAGIGVNATTGGAYTMVRRCSFQAMFTGIRLGNVLSCVDDVEVRYFKNSGIIVDHNSDHQINLAIMDNNTGALPTGGGIQVLQAASLLLSNCNIIHSNFCLDIAPAGGVTIPSVKGVNCFFDTSAVGLNMTSAGSFFRSEFTNCWFSSMSIAGVRISPTGSNGVDGITFVNCDVYNNVGGTTTGVLVGTANVGKWKMVGCSIAGWTSGVSLTAGANHFPTIIGNTIGAVAAFGANGTGVVIGAGAYRGITLTDNDVVDNTAACNFGTFTTTAGNLSIRENSGINPPSVAAAVDVAFNNVAATPVTITIPANSLIAGRTFEYEMYSSVINTTAASNLVIDVMLNGVAIATSTFALGTTAFAAPGRVAHVQGSVTFRTTGATGTAIASQLFIINAVAPTLTNVITPTTVNTTAAVTLSLRIATSAATSTGTVRQAAIYVGT